MPFQVANAIKSHSGWQTISAIPVTLSILMGTDKDALSTEHDSSDNTSWIRPIRSPADPVYTIFELVATARVITWYS
jgi:hypothetical protein